jgi:outer membrane protein TolC
MKLVAAAASIALFSSGELHADVLSHALDAGGGASAPADPTDLIAWSGAARPITLPDLLQLAVRQAPALQTAKIDIAVAEAQIAQTYGRNDWLVTGQVTGSRSSGVFSGIAVTQSTQFSVSAGISRALPTGGTIGLHAATRYDHSESDTFNSRSWFDDVGIDITQPLFRGRGVWLFNANQRRAELTRDVAVLARRLAAMQTVEAVVSAYWDLVLAERQIAITEASLALARERLRVTEIGAKGGKIAEAEIPAVQQIIATREEDLLNQQLVVLDRSLTLRRAVGLPIGQGEIGLRVDPDLEIPDRTWDLHALIERAYQISPELAELATRQKDATLEIEVTENGLMPQLDAALSFGPTGTGEAFDEAGKSLVKLEQLQISGSLTFSQSLERTQVRGRVRELRTNRQKLRVNDFDVRQQLAQTMTRAVAQVELARRRVVLSQRAIDLANENIRIETDRFSLGKSTNFDVLNRQEELRQAELRKAQALIDWHKAETVVQTLTAELLPAFGITVE